MTHFRKYYDSDYIGSWDLGDREIAVEIASVKPHKIPARKKGERPKRKLLIHFKGAKTGKGYVCNVTNAKIIAALYGDDIEQWVGKRISLYVGMVNAYGEMHKSIMVKDRAPTGKTQEIPDSPPDHDPETGEVRETGDNGKYADSF